MSTSIDERAARLGIMRTYHGLDGRAVTACDEAVTALITAFEGGSEPAPWALERGRLDRRVHDGSECYQPDFIRHGRAWGVTCQLYGLRSARNWGIGDFEDLAGLGELMARFGADFLGTNPLHALFLAAPERCSPFFPSDRGFLNPLYIAVDKVPAFDPEIDLDGDGLAGLRHGELVDYPRVAACKMKALWQIFHRGGHAGARGSELAAFARSGGERLVRFARFQALSLAMKEMGAGAGWHGWPDDLKDPDGANVLQFAAERAQEVTFQIWLQWIAEQQISSVARRLHEAGMRIGLYLDLAVGTAPDGAATWSDRRLSVVGAEIGSPPDMFNPNGQKWGLAPMAASELMARGCRPFAQICEAVLRHAGALRIDHVMSLHRLFCIPWQYPASQGAYVRYPMADLVRALSEVSRQSRAIVIGEDLGVVPEGFRADMERAGILGYRLFLFERDHHGFIPPERWPACALACAGSHDTPTLAGWWTGRDIDQRERIGLVDPSGGRAERQARERERRDAAGLIGLAQDQRHFDLAVAVGIYRLLASSPARLLAVQIEDLLGLTEQANIPGTVDEHPNWRRRLPVALEVLEEQPMLRAVLEGVSQARPALS